MKWILFERAKEEIALTDEDLKELEKIREAYKIMKGLDEKDAPLLALALKLRCLIWSNDDFKEQNIVEVYTTSYMLKTFFGELERG